MLLLVLGLMMFGVAIYFIAEVATSTARQRSVAIGRATRYGELSRQGAAELKFRERVLEPGVARLARISLKLNPRMTVQTVEAKLLSAGLARKVTPTAFLATKAALGVAGLAFGHFTEIPPDQTNENRALDDLLREVADRCAVPCVASIPVGHIADQWTLPFGRTAVLDADSRTLTIE